jgi:hypothetical protein
MGVDVYPTRGYEQSGCVDLSGARADVGANGNNDADTVVVLVDRHIGDSRPRPCAIDNIAVTDNQIVHDCPPWSALRSADVWCVALVAHDVSNHR